METWTNKIEILVMELIFGKVTVCGPATFSKFCSDL